jgi:hypothetical protein
MNDIFIGRVHVRGAGGSIGGAETLVDPGGDGGCVCGVGGLRGSFVRACLCGSPNSTGRFGPADRGGVRGGRWLCVVDVRCVLRLL